MWTSRLRPAFGLALAALVLTAGTAQPEEPLSAIDWLRAHPPSPGQPLGPDPAIRAPRPNPRIDVAPLPVLGPAAGLVPARVTGLDPALWASGDPDALADQIIDTPLGTNPAMQALLYRTLLSEARMPVTKGDDGDGLLLARLDRLMAAGAAEAARALVEQAGPLASPARFTRWLDASLLTGDEDRPCATLATAPYLAPDHGARIYCDMRRGDWQTAALTLEVAHALDLLPAADLNLLDRFLSPEIFEGTPPLPPPDRIDPLRFRLMEGIGEPLPTRGLPPAFAVADLRGLSGWKAEIEAAERLVRQGALSANRLLGLYTDRRPAASGGVWDRVRLVQRVDADLLSGDAAALAVSLPQAWEQMREAGLAPAFAQIFAARLAALPAPPPELAALIWRIRLLDPAETAQAARALPAALADDSEALFLAALAAGQVPDLPPDGTPGSLQGSRGAAEIAAAFRAEPVPALPATGTAILTAIERFHRGGNGDPAALTAALGDLRAMGLEAAARDAALAYLILEAR